MQDIDTSRAAVERVQDEELIESLRLWNRDDAALTQKDRTDV